ncbi:MAG: methyl-accepting chemotaxis protein, partial [Candidatus Heimdallarchaeota archaeon]
MFDTEKGLYQRIFSFFFDEQNFWKALPVLIAPSIIIGIISFSLANLLSSDLKNTKIDVEYNIIFIPISVLGGLIILWILFGNSLYFRLSLYNLIAIANISLFCYLTIYLGGTFGDNLFLYPPAVIFALFMIVYTINSVRRPIELLNEGTNKAATGNLDIEEKNIGIYGMEFAHLEKSFLSMMRNIALILTSAQKTTEKLSSYSVDFVTMFAAVEAMSAEISDNVQEVIQGATNQADVAQKGIDSIKTMSQLVENALRDIENTTQVIEGIAKQTNMLSLNASIESPSVLAGGMNPSMMISKA